MTANTTQDPRSGWSQLDTALVWCLAWGPDQKCRDTDLVNVLPLLREIQDTKNGQNQTKPDVSSIAPQAQVFVDLVWDLKQVEFPETQEAVNRLLGGAIGAETATVGLIYGGATKIKQYVFEGAKLPDVRGASALLERINFIDLPALFGKVKVQDKKRVSLTIKDWLHSQSQELADALIPELIIYSTGGNILAFCPPAFVDVLADTIEARYSEETLTANSCAVGQVFRLLELRLGCLQAQIQDNQVQWWQEDLEKRFELPIKSQNPKNLVTDYFYRRSSSRHEEDSFATHFQNRKSFNELVTKLAIAFNQRRAGMVVSGNRLTRRYPPMLETHPYLLRDDHDRRSAIDRSETKGKVSEVLARKRVVGEITKRKQGKDQLPLWWSQLQAKQQEDDCWDPLMLFFESWGQRFEHAFEKSEAVKKYSNTYYQGCAKESVTEARNLREIGNVADPGQGFVAYIYADGNNMGGYIQGLRTPQEYQQFSKDISKATEQAVYIALAKHLTVRQIQNLQSDPGEDENRNSQWIHPFEIVTIGGDDVFLIVPADKALAIAQSIGEEFERLLLDKSSEYRVKETDRKQSDDKPDQKDAHHYDRHNAPESTCHLSMSIGVLITAEDTPIYYAQNLVEQLLKSAKQRAKSLKKDYHYYGGTIDFLVLKSVTMISSKISEFRKQALEIEQSAASQNPHAKKHTLRLYGGPYTLHEIGGLLQTLQALKESEFPKSQLYQIRGFLEQGKRTAILNYRYFRTRLNNGKGQTLEEGFEEPWCGAKNNPGNLAPWMTSSDQEGKTIYTTIWRDLVDLLPFFEASQEQDSQSSQSETQNQEVLQ